MSNTVAIVDYGLCNLDSIRRALEECGANAFITDDPKAVATANRCVLPGVGAFAKAMENLRSTGLDDAVREHALEAQRPFLGVCLGMHLMGGTGEEGRIETGLNLIPSRIVRLQPSESLERVPHIGWNVVDPVLDCPLLDGIPANTDFYFVHSYHMRCETESDIVATTPYCGRFVSVIQRDNIVGTQFHPEKSQAAGFRLLENFLST